MNGGMNKRHGDGVAMLHYELKYVRLLDCSDRAARSRGSYREPPFDRSLKGGFTLIGHIRARFDNDLLGLD